MTRKLLTLLVVASLLTVGFAQPVAAGLGDSAEDVFAGGVAEVDSFDDTPDWVATYDAGKPGVYVTYEDGKSSSVETWVNQSTDRVIQHHDSEDNRMLISMPLDDLGAGLLDRLRYDTISEKSYVEQVAFVHSFGTMPVDDLMNESEAVAPTGSWSVRSGDWSTEGVAYEGNAEKSTLSDAREAMDTDEVSEDGTGVTVAVLDTGLNAENGSDPLYGDRVVDPYNGVTDTEGFDAVSTGTAHGPWVTASIAANASNDSYDGVAPNATVMPVKVLSDDGSGSTQSVIRGIEHAEANGADVVSLSLGSVRYDTTLANAIQEALEGNVTTVIVAAGNSRQQPGHLRYVNSPGDADGVITVAATNVSNASTAGSAYFSSVGPDSGADMSEGKTAGEMPDIAAPGMQITAPMLTESGTRTNETLSGTSMATPLVSGVAALTLEANPELVNDTDAFRETMLDSAEPVPGAGVTEVGEGMADGENAVSHTTVEADQDEARNAPAEGRDGFNRGYSGSRIVEFAVDARGAAS